MQRSGKVCYEPEECLRGMHTAQRCQEQERSSFGAAPRLMSSATRMPMVMESWNMMLRQPRRCTGAISLRYSGTLCVASPAHWHAHLEKMYYSCSETAQRLPI